jgi:hypothetical protein
VSNNFSYFFHPAFSCLPSHPFPSSQKALLATVEVAFWQVGFSGTILAGNWTHWLHLQLGLHTGFRSPLLPPMKTIKTATWRLYLCYSIHIWYVHWLL